MSLISLQKHFNLRGPLFLSPMAGGPSTPALAAAVSNAGGMGSLGGAYLTAEQLEGEIKNTQALTSRPFGVNLFVPAADPVLAPQQLQLAITATRAYRQELQINEKPLEPPFSQDFNKQIEVVLRLKPALFSFVFGLVDKAIISELKKQGIFTMGAVTSAEEAVKLQETGVQSFVAQGVEAGGHRALFDDKQKDPRIGVIQLTQDCLRVTDLPLVAAGGLMTGADIRKVLDLGAQGAQLGTAFLACEEAGTSKPYLRALLTSPRRTRLTRAFSGRWARGLENRFMLEMENRMDAILPYPAQNTFTRDIRNASAQQDKNDFLSLWAGEGVEQITQTKAGELADQLLTEAGF